MTPGDAAALADYVQKRAPVYGLDPRAVMAVASQEGLGGGIGDNGTSFGPWQMHQGGAYPSSAPQEPASANAWAWSPAGIDYALGRMSSVAGNQKGPTAVHSIVYDFERPANPAKEYAGALAVYDKSARTNKGSSFWADVAGAAVAGLPLVGPVASAVGSATGGVGNLVGDVTGGVSGAAGGLTGGLDSIAKAFEFLVSIRFLEVVAGGVLLMLGVYLLARRVGLAPQARTIAAATPAGRAAIEAGAI